MPIIIFSNHFSNELFYTFFFFFFFTLSVPLDAIEVWKKVSCLAPLPSTPQLVKMGTCPARKMCLRSAPNTKASVCRVAS